MLAGIWRDALKYPALPATRLLLYQQVRLVGLRLLGDDHHARAELEVNASALEQVRSWLPLLEDAFSQAVGCPVQLLLQEVGQ